MTDLSACGTPALGPEQSVAFGAVVGSVAVLRDGSDSRRAAETLRRNEERLRLMFQASPLPMWTLRTDTLAFVSVNEAAVEHYGYSVDEFALMTLPDVLIGSTDPVLGETVRPGTKPMSQHRRKDGSVLTVETTTNDFEFEGQHLRLAFVNDVTERERAQQVLRLTEEQLRQSQKMDAVGQLAGGIAHDFNNLLSVIDGYCGLMMDELAADSPMREDLEQVAKAGKRAGELTRQLLLFSRQQVLAPKVLDLNEVVASSDKMLQRTLGASIDLVTLAARDLGRVRADACSIEQVVMNLAVNARDAMPAGGQLTIETGNVILDQDYASAHHGAIPGPHVMIAVSDTGVGMDSATLSRIFEPFFTTKERGKGTGLGLSTVFGIVRQSRGTVWVYSEPGRGTTFKIYLPRVESELDEALSHAEPKTLRGTETVLLVDDDDQVRGVTRAILQRSGYQVLDARNAGEAMLRSENHPTAIDLLITDVVMPQMSGPELAKRLDVQRPGIKVLCMSGYTDDSIVRHGVLGGEVAYLQKPATPYALTKRVRDVLTAS